MENVCPSPLSACTMSDTPTSSACQNIDHLFDNNARWVQRMTDADPDYFTRLKDQQAPAYLWIGCSDSRVPANQITDLPPGEVFVHRNIANVVAHTDLNCLSVVQFAVDHLKVRHILVVGHYGCSGVRAALLNQRIGLTDSWIRHVRDVYDRHADELVALPIGEARHKRLVELNVIEQVNHLAHAGVVNDAWQRGQPLSLHGCVYGLHDGRLRDLGVTTSGVESGARQ